MKIATVSVAHATRNNVLLRWRCPENGLIPMRIKKKNHADNVLKDDEKIALLW